MGYVYQDNVYNSPEKFGLEVIYNIGDPEASYSFANIVLWKRLEDGKLFWAWDSGCSCPSPFEDFYSVDSLNPLPETARDLEARLRSDYPNYNTGSVRDFLKAAKVI